MFFAGGLVVWRGILPFLADFGRLELINADSNQRIICYNLRYLRERVILLPSQHARADSILSVLPDPDLDLWAYPFYFS